MEIALQSWQKNNEVKIKQRRKRMAELGGDWRGLKMSNQTIAVKMAGTLSSGLKRKFEEIKCDVKATRCYIIWCVHKYIYIYI